MASIFLLLLAPSSILVWAHDGAVLPLADDDNDDGEDFTSRRAPGRLLFLEFLFFLAFGAVSLLAMALTVYASSMAYTDSYLTLKDVVLRTLASWKRPMKTCLCVAVITVAYASFLLMILGGLSLIVTGDALTASVVVLGSCASVQMCKTRTAVRILSNGLRARGPIPCKFSSKIPKGKDLTLLKKNEAFLRYELLTELESQLASVLSKSVHVDDLVKTHSPSLVAQRPVENVNYCSVGTEEKQNSGTVSMGECHSHHVENFLIAGRSELNGLKRKRTSNVVAPAWSLCEASFGKSTTLSKSTKNIIKCLQGREWGSSWVVACSHGAYAGRNKEKWIPFIEGWKSLGRQFEGPAVLFGQRSYSSWVPTWCAYTSSAAVAQPFGRTEADPCQPPFDTWGQSI